MLLGFIAALLFALIFSAILSVGFRRRGPGPVNGVFYFFLLILVFSWAGGTWLYPIGPVFWNIPWFGFLITAFFVMMLIAVLVPPVKATVMKESKQEDTAEDVVAITFGFLFWTVIVALILAAILGAYR